MAAARVDAVVAPSQPKPVTPALEAWAHVPSWLTPLVVGALTALVFAGSLWNDFVHWDDHTLFLQNPAYRGLGATQLSWMFSTVLMGHYIPVTWLTHGLDYVLWGMNPAGYHLTNVLLHAAGAALFYLVALRLLAAATAFPPATLRLAAAAAALFFALHPLRTESVAWVTERRDVLSGVFFFLTLVLYLRAVEHGRRRRLALHAAALTAYVLAIFSKSIVMTLPAVLVLLDFYPLRRLGPDWRRWTEPPAWTIWREKLPYAALGLLAAMLGYYAQAMNGFFTPSNVVSWSARPALVLHSLWFYVSKTVLPLRLSPLYELPATIDPLAVRFLVPAGMVLLITALAVAFRRRFPAGLAVWLSYTILLAPVMGLTHSGFQLAHDRYSYLSCLGFALLVGAAVGAVATMIERGAVTSPVARAATLGAVLWFGGFGVLTWQQVEAWRDTEALWRHAAEAEPTCALCRHNLGSLVLTAGVPNLARAEFERALQSRPDRVQVHGPLGLAEALGGDLEEAVRHYRKRLASAPLDSNTRNNLGAALLRLHRHEEALGELQQAHRLAPDSAIIRMNLGMAHAAAGHREQALSHLARAIELRPDMPAARFALGISLIGWGDIEAAREQHEALRAEDPGRASILGPGLLATW